jgi:hypothetical protein
VNNDQWPNDGIEWSITVALLCVVGMTWWVILQ